MKTCPAGIRHAAGLSGPAGHSDGAGVSGSTGSRRGADERGSAALEAVILLPLLLLFVVAVVFAGRLALAQQQVDAIADSAARAASLQRSAGEARIAAGRVAAAAAASRDLKCVPTVVADLRGFATPVGVPASVTVRVSCVVGTSDITIPGIPGTRTLTGEGRSPLDTYRGRR